MKMISEQHFLECAEYVYHCAEQSTINNDPPTQFEILTAIALEFFVRQKCDIVLLEVGLGGTLDSTNIIPPPLLQIITSISLDHTNILQLRKLQKKSPVSSKVLQPLFIQNYQKKYFRY